MINLQLTGGLGNQMFEYAFARALQQKTKEKIAVNTYGFRFDYQRDYALSAFALKDNVNVLEEKKGKKQWKRSQLINRLLFLFKKANGAANFYRLTKAGLYFTFDIYNFYDYALSRKKEKYVFGTFQTEKYFREIKDVLLEDFRLAVPLKKEIMDLAQEMGGCESVSVHIRRGDYVSNENDDKILNICSQKYYRQAMDWMGRQVENPVFYIFSNTHEDIEWIKENYHWKEENIRYVDMGNRDYEELFLMSACRHFIIANSTYSWWAQYLGRYPQKKVAAPKRWFEGGQDASDIYMETWKIIEV